MKNNLPTYEDCLNILKQNPDPLFLKKEVEVQGYKIVIFNYRFARYEQFINPIPNSDIQAIELRGLTFVFNGEGGYKRFLALEKFWNINEVPSTQYKELKHKSIKQINIKDDGSLIMFIQLPNGNIIPKTKMGFDNEQVEMTNEYLKRNPKILKFIENCLTCNLLPFFELVSFKNKIVLNYNEPELRLLKLRSNTTGEYIDLKDISFSIDNRSLIVNRQYEDVSLDILIERAGVLENIEGWVIEFIPHQFIKIKTGWYFARHKLITEQLHHEHDIIRLILENKIDDIISQLDEINDALIIQFINDIQNKLIKFQQDLIVELKIKLQDFNNNIKEFVNKYASYKYFGLLMSNINGKDLNDSVTEYILKKTYRLELARTFLNNLF